jgi:catechol 2,3-dioxygenase-like lactoylglutathione lyase family enzyme
VIQTVLPTSFTVADMERALQLYCDVLGFTVVGRPPSRPRGGPLPLHPVWGELPERLPDEDDRANWDPYQERVCGIPGARINIFLWLAAPDGETMLELLEYAPPDSPELPPRRSFVEPGKTTVVLSAVGLEELVGRLREVGGLDLVSVPQRYESASHVPSLCCYAHDQDDNALCLVERLDGSGGEGGIRSVLQTSITVARMERALEFYCDRLGFTISGRDESQPRGGPTYVHPLWGPRPEHLPAEQDRARWDPYQERVAGVPGARIREFCYLVAPDGKTPLEVVEYEPLSDARQVPRPRAFNEPGKAIVVMAATELPELAAGLRAEGAALVNDPQWHATGDSGSWCAYLHDPDGNAICLVERVPAAVEAASHRA